ncbi:hypothetical protein ACTHGU_21955 [Chitinophagaceae bacterium MMS25-I14]
MHLRKIITLAIPMLLAGAAGFAQSSPYPQISTSGKNIRSFIPAGWEIRDSVLGDFNRDGVNDAALVIQQIKPTPEDKDCFSSGEAFHLKMLLILFGHQSGYALSVKATKMFGKCNWGVQGLDPYSNLSVRRNILCISFLTGGTERDVISYYARYKDNDWYVIGANSYSYWAGHPETGDYTIDVNLVTGIQERYETTEKGKRKDYKKKAVPKMVLKLTDLSDDTDTYIADEQ